MNLTACDNPPVSVKVVLARLPSASDNQLEALIAYIATNGSVSVAEKRCTVIKSVTSHNDGLYLDLLSRALQHCQAGLLSGAGRRCQIAQLVRT
jgi:hypothetical protein